MFRLGFIRRATEILLTFGVTSPVCFKWREHWYLPGIDQLWEQTVKQQETEPFRFPQLAYQENAWLHHEGIIL